MNEESAAIAAPGQASRDGDAGFELIENALRTGGPAAALDQLIAQLSADGEYRALLDALLLKSRHELGLPLIASGPLSDLPEPQRSRYEEQYVEAIRLIGSKYLVTGDIPTAFAYYRAIAEPEPVAKAIDEYRPSENDERLGAIIEVAFNHGVSTRRGFGLILDHYGTCPAISAFEQLPPHDVATRAGCAERLIAHLHKELVANLRSEISSRGQLVPSEGSSIAELLRGRDWLFSDDSYHIDTSHLAAVVRFALIVTAPAFIALAADLTEYGRRLAPRLQFDGPPPFQRVFDDHRVYLRALLGQEVDNAIAHFQAKLVSSDDGLGSDPTMPAQTLVNLLVRVGRLDQAIDVAAENLAGLPESALSCPTTAQLCQRAGDLERLAKIARDHGDLVDFTAGLLGTIARAFAIKQPRLWFRGTVIFDRNQTGPGEFRGGYLQKAAEEIIPPPILVFDGVQRRQSADAEQFRENRISVGDAQLDDRDQRHEGPSQVELLGTRTTIGASRQMPLP